MKTIMFIVGAVVAAILGGCTTPSLNGLATEANLAKDAGLVGRWVDKENDDNTYVVTAAPDRAYHLECIPKDASKKPIEFDFQLVKLGSTQFMDMTVSKAGHDELGERFGTTVIPAHVFMK